MARYRRIDPRIWSDEKFRRFSREEKLVALYVLTAQSNRIGLFRFSPALAAEDLDLPLKTFWKAFRKVCKAVGWKFDEEARVLLIPKWFRYNQPANPNVLKSCLEDLHDLPQTPLLEEFRSCVEYLPQTFHKTFLEGLEKRLAERLPKHSTADSSSTCLLKQEQEQEQEQEKENTFCSETQGVSEPPSQLGEAVVLVFPCDGPVRQWVLTERKLREYQESFPNLDVLAEFRVALQWLRDNPSRRKTARGMPRFLTNWLSRAQDRRRASNATRASFPGSDETARYQHDPQRPVEAL